MVDINTHFREDLRLFIENRLVHTVIAKVHVPAVKSYLCPDLALNQCNILNR